MTEGKIEQTETQEPQVTHIIDAADLVIRKLIPGILVVLTCHLRGGRRTYKANVRVIEQEDGSHVEEWEARRVTEDPDEVKAGDALRAEVHRKVKGLGVETAVGLIVPITRQQDLATTLSNCAKKVATFNAEAKTLDVVYYYGLYESESGNKAAIAAINDSLDGILNQINEATVADDERILAYATRADLVDPLHTSTDDDDTAPTLTAAQVLSGPPERRRLIVARVRAKLARKALKEAQSFSSLLPEETGRAVDNLVKEIRTKATAWVAASKEDEESYQKALGSVPVAGISAMQAALVMAAAQANADVHAAADAVSEGEASFVLGSGIAVESADDEIGEIVAAPSPFLGVLSGMEETGTDNE